MNLELLMRKVRVALTPRESLLKTRLSNGAIVFGKNRKGYGGRGIFLYRDSIEPEFLHLDQFLDSTGVFVDVGANTGIYTMKAAKHFSGHDGVVLALEPFPDVLATLFYTMQVNGFTNVRLRNVCAGESTGPAKFWMNFDKPNSFSLVKHDEHAACLPTLVVALDDLFAWEQLDRLDYLKIDAEGAEQSILTGARNIIERQRPIIQLEVTIDDTYVPPKNYSIFKAPNSPNKVYIPSESPKIRLPKQLGWSHIA